MADKAIIAWAEDCKGPGWSNSVIWYVLRDDNGNLYLEDIQPEEQTQEMWLLFGSSKVSAEAMTRQVNKFLSKR